LERLESTFKSCNYVGNICVYATQHANHAIAIVIPHEPNLRHALSSLSSSSSSPSISPDADLATLCENKKVKDLVTKECNSVGKKNGFKPMELLANVVLTAEEWTPENGLVTAAQKINRSAIARHYKEQITVSVA
jgi:long-chain acyl-CoA synthetase